jgi:hypothetical protein
MFAKTLFKANRPSAKPEGIVHYPLDTWLYSQSSVRAVRISQTSYRAVRLAKAWMRFARHATPSSAVAVRLFLDFGRQFNEAPDRFSTRR